MSTPIIMPKFEMSQETGTVARWLKQEGDAVDKGEAILEVETDKVTMEVESPARGILSAISAQPGDVVPIGQVIARVDDGRQRTTDERRPTTATETTDERRPTTASSERSSVVGPLTPFGAGGPSSSVATPIAIRIAAEAGIDLATIRGTGKNGQITREDVEKRATDDRRPTTAQTTDDGRRTTDDGSLSSVIGRPSSSAVAAVPAARRLARERGVDLRDVRGTGPGGRIQSGDVEKKTTDDRRPTTAAETTDDRRPTTARTTDDRRQTTAPEITGDSIPSSVVRSPSSSVPLTPMRRTIAQRMLASVREAPQFNLSVDVNMARALVIVEDHKQAANTPNAPKITLTAFLIKACAWALARHPAVNASYTSDGIIEYTDVNVGIAVAIDDGLVVPVIRRASTLDLPAIAAQLSDLATRARAGKLTPADMQDGTFSISNLGMFAVDRFTAIVNPPQAAILAVGRTTKRFVPDANDQPIAAPMATLTVSADHRAVDGAQIGRFLGDLQQAIERPGVML